MKYRIAKRMNPLNTEETKFYAAPQYAEELTVSDLAQDISDSCTLNVTAHLARAKASDVP